MTVVSNLSCKKVIDLRKMAKERKIKRYSRMRKQELIDILRPLISTSPMASQPADIRDPKHVILSALVKWRYIFKKKNCSLTMIDTIEFPFFVKKIDDRYLWYNVESLVRYFLATLRFNDPTNNIIFDENDLIIIGRLSIYTTYKRRINFNGIKNSSKIHKKRLIDEQIIQYERIIDNNISDKILNHLELTVVSAESWYNFVLVEMIFPKYREFFEICQSSCIEHIEKTILTIQNLKQFTVGSKYSGFKTDKNYVLRQLRNLHSKFIAYHKDNLR